MGTEPVVSAATLIAFLLVLVRIGAMLAFVPFPGFRSGPDPARVVLALLMTWCVKPVWPVLPSREPDLGTLTMWILGESAFGVLLGLFTSYLIEAFQMAAQIFGLQAGYSYASTIDPTTQADSGVLAIVTQLMAGLCFFTTGIDREILRAVAHSIERVPPGTFLLTRSMADAAIHAGSAMFSTGLRIALPVVGFLLMVDLALALLGRMQTQLQLLSLAFPAKMLASLILLASLAGLMPLVFRTAAERALANLAGVLGG